MRSRPAIALLCITLTLRAVALVSAQSSSLAASAASDAEKFQALVEKAQGGDAISQALVGAAVNDSGYPDQAAVWFQRAADQGLAIAQSMLGRQYMYGRGVPQDYQHAAELFVEAAQQGDVQASSLLARLYAGGRGVAQDNREAARWARVAANGDCRSDSPYCALAQSLLAALYFNGDGVPQDYELAYVWANLAGAAMPEGEERQTIVSLRDAVAAQLSPQQLEHAQRLAREWHPGSSLSDPR